MEVTAHPSPGGRGSHPGQCVLMDEILMRFPALGFLTREEVWRRGQSWTLNKGSYIGIRVLNQSPAQAITSEHPSVFSHHKYLIPKETVLTREEK